MYWSCFWVITATLYWIKTRRAVIKLQVTSRRRQTEYPRKKMYQKMIISLGRRPNSAAFKQLFFCPLHFVGSSTLILFDVQAKGIRCIVGLLMTFNLGVHSFKDCGCQDLSLKRSICLSFNPMNIDCISTPDTHGRVKEVVRGGKTLRLELWFHSFKGGNLKLVPRQAETNIEQTKKITATFNTGCWLCNFGDFYS